MSLNLPFYRSNEQWDLLWNHNGLVLWNRGARSPQNLLSISKNLLQVKWNIRLIRVILKWAQGIPWGQVLVRLPGFLGSFTTGMISGSNKSFAQAKPSFRDPWKHESTECDIQRGMVGGREGAELLSASEVKSSQYQNTRVWTKQQVLMWAQSFQNKESWTLTFSSGPFSHL